MAAPSRYELIRFLRYVYTNGGATSATRSALIATEYEAARKAGTQGRWLQAAGTGGATTSYGQTQGWDPAFAAELCERAESYIGADTISDAMAAVPSRVTSCRTYSTYVFCQ